MREKQKNAAAVMLGKRRFTKLSPEEHSAFSQNAVNARESQREQRKMTMIEKVQETHIPTYLKIQLLSASRDGASGGDMKNYFEVGYHLGNHHLEDFCEDVDRLGHVKREEVTANPTRVLRRIFASSEHPRGELTDLIPLPRRRRFLLGLLAGADDEGPGDYWSSAAGIER